MVWQKAEVCTGGDRRGEKKGAHTSPSFQIILQTVLQFNNELFLQEFGKEFPNFFSKNSKSEGLSVRDRMSKEFLRPFVAKSRKSMSQNMS